MDVSSWRTFLILWCFVPVVLIYYRLTNPVSDVSPLIRYTYSGAVDGIVVESSGGKSVDAYLGIPYAAPPIGTLRFKPPEDVHPWSAVFQAKSNRVSCFQVEEDEAKRSNESWWVSNAPESEDCLLLNVWVPKPRPNNAAVLVWIHGGSFSHGSTAVDNFDGKDLAAEEGLVVVTINYRLSVFGFLYLDHEEVPGNVGLMDQAKALKWVQTNIRAFGGDPERVTLFGHSSGAVSAGLQFVNQNNRGLFKHLIMAGGFPETHSSMTSSSRLRLSRHLANEMGCHNGLNDKEKLITCLRSKDPRDIVSNLLDQPTLGPVLDGHYFPEDTNAAFEKLFPADRSIMIASTREEGVVEMILQFPDRDVSEATFYTIEDYKFLINRTLGYPPEPILKVAMYHYMDLDDPDDLEKLRENMIRFSTDFAFVCISVEFLNTLSDIGHKMYQLIFAHRQVSSTHLPIWAGVMHGEELQFIFGRPLDSKNGFNEEEALLSRKTMRYFANFAKFGEPNAYEDAVDLSLPRWPQYSVGGRAYLLLDLQPAVERALSSTGCALRRALPDMIKALQQDILEKSKRDKQFV